METIVLYLLKTSGLITLFYISYYLLLSKETFFNSNRYFLISGLFTSIVLPFLYYTKIIIVNPTPINLSQYTYNKQQFATDIATNQINWMYIFSIAYLIGFALFIGKFLFDYFSLNKVIKGKKTHYHSDFKFVDVQENIAPFSYFNTIVYNSNLYSKTELENILEHEKIHSEQHHTIDVLLARLFCVLFWFNPIIWLYQKAILQNLEFIADYEATKRLSDKKQYQLTLLKITTHENGVAITNHFYQSLIKKRIIMLNKIQSNKKNYAKYALIIPALAAFIYVFQVNVIAQEKSISVVSHSETNDEIVLLIDKNSTDEQLKKETTVFKEKQGILLKISKITRNSKQEITGIKIEFDDKKGNKGINEVNGDKPIQPITFVKTIDENGKSQIGFNTNKSGSEDESVYTYSYSNSEDAPEPPTPPTPPTAPDYSKIPVPTVKMPAMPKPPRVPSNLNDEKAMKKFDQDMAAFDKKMEKLQPQISNFEKEMEKYQSEMDALNPDMEKFDKEMEKFDIEMEKFDKKMAEYQDQMQTQNMEVEKTIVKSNKKIKK